MSNVHLRSSVEELQRAISDITTKQKQIRDDAENEKRSVNDAIKDIQDQQKALHFQASKNDSAMETATINAKISSLEAEISDLNKKQYQIEDDARKLIQDYDNNMSEIKQIISRIQAINY
jgi:chromosome segregation ATPase